MRLKQLRINGFKSFADTTVIEFPGAVSGIVGPNGCGKSNVIDAIRWVLGEARVSELRGSSSMSELIFAGSSNRPASSRASVEMVLDNSDGSVSGAWGRYTELSVKRIVTRDGTNAYLINNQQVRRRDVQDIFMGTGLGPRSYAIISQGMISNFIKAKPEELRVYLEEAAGVSKYKERRRETESALNSTRNNLEKVHYLQETKREEVERLTGEAEVARRWRELEDERLQSELLWYFLQEKGARDEVDRINAKIAAKELEMVTARGQAQELVLQIEELREAARLKREAADAARQAAWQVESRVTEIEGNIRHIVEKKDTLARQIASQTEAMVRRRAEKSGAAARIEELTRQRGELTARAEELDEEAAAMEEECLAKSDEHESCRAAYEEARKKAQDAENKINVFSVQIEALSREVNNAEDRLAALKSESRPSAAPDEARFEELSAVIEEKTAELEENAAQAEELAQELEGARSDFEAVRSKKEALAAGLERTAARLQALESLQAKAEGEGRLPAWLQKMGLDTMPRLFESLEVEPRWAVALEAVLSVRASALAMTELTRAAGFDFDPPPARLVFYGRGAVAEPANVEGLTPLANFVSSSDPLIQEGVRVWLAGVYVAEDLPGAVAARGKLPHHGRFVTHKGHIVDAVSISYWAEESQSAGVMSRASEIKELTAKLHGEREQAESAAEALIAAKARVSDLEVRHKAKLAFCQALRDQAHTVEVEHSALSAAIAAWRQRSVRLAQEMSEVSGRLEELSAEREELEERYAQMEEGLSDLQQAAVDAKAHLEETETALADLEESARSVAQQAQMARLEAQNAASRAEDARRQCESADEEIEIMAAALEELAAEREQLDEDAEREGLGRVLRERDEKAQAHAAAEDESRRAEEALEAARGRQSELNEAQAPLLQEITDLKVRRETYTTQGAAFTERLNECGADRKTLEETVIAENLKVGALKARVTRLAEQIAELGAVNHAALENLEASRKAMAETERQVADLQEAIDNLEATIRKIDAETRELLKNTFDEVNRNFGEMFTGLFGGGSAQLKMSGEEILEAGVEVVAQPPGKRNASVRLLSGGEQAMTATALVFAIFRLNPAPFCLLDEVDAPLDEANQDRLARRIIEMSGNTQFMMITHHRVTMEHIGQLVGVTMKEPGVSRVVAVDVSAAVDMAKQ